MDDTFSRVDGALHWLGRPLETLAASLETPVFLFDAERIRENVASLRRAQAESGIDGIVRYCAKTNYEAGVLDLLAGLGVECLVSHEVEARIAIRAGFESSHLVYQRPVLLEPELEAILGLGIRATHIQRPTEAERIARCAERAGASEVRVSLRIARARTFSPLAGLASRVGLSPEEALAVAEDLRSPLRIHGVNVYVGTQQGSPRAFSRDLDEIVDLASRFADAGRPLAEIDLGGGVPSPGLDKLGLRALWRRWRDLPLASPPSREEFTRRVAERFLERCVARGLEPPPRLVTEVGRSVVGDAGLLLSTVREVDGRWIFLDASSNYLGESKLLFRRPIHVLGDDGAGRSRFVHLSGSTLNTMDVLDLRRRLPPLARGDRLAFGEAGAYSLSRARRYAGLTPAAHLIEPDGSLRPIRRAEAVEDVIGPMRVVAE